MKTWILNYLQCPKCGSVLKNNIFEDDHKGEIVYGILTCSNRSCRTWYPISQGIPRLLPESFRLKLTQEFGQKYHKELSDLGLITLKINPDKDNLHDLKQHTIQNFGFEWINYDRFGWDDSVYNMQHEKEIFFYKSLLEPEEIRGKLILDAGCGNGRYSYWAAKHGGHVIGVDLGDGVESARNNTKDLPHVQIIQGDIFNLPVRNNCIDIIYSIGVLMHTGDAKKATFALTKKLKTNGSLTVHLYGKGNFIYEFADRAIRKKTTRMSIPELQKFTNRLYKIRRILEKIWLTELINLFVKIDPHPVCIFDWYAAPVATHHSYKEVKNWFDELKMTIFKTNERQSILSPRIKTKNRFKLFSIRLIKKLVQPLQNTTVTVRGHLSKSDYP